MAGRINILDGNVIEPEHPLPVEVENFSEVTGADYPATLADLLAALEGLLLATPEGFATEATLAAVLTRLVLMQAAITGEDYPASLKDILDALQIEGGLRIAGVVGGTPVPVSVATAPALVGSEAHIGAIGGHTVGVTVTPTLTVAGAYAAGDFVGTSTVAMDFTPTARLAAGSGVILRAVIVDKAAQAKSCELWLFHTAPAGLPNDNAAFTITDTDAANCIAVIPFNTWYSSALNSISIGSIANGQTPFVCDAADQSLFGVLVTRDAPTYATGDVQVTLFISQD